MAQQVKWFSEEDGNLEYLVDLDKKLREPPRLRAVLARIFAPVLQVCKRVEDIRDLLRRLCEVLTAPLHLFRYLSRS